VFGIVGHVYVRFNPRKGDWVMAAFRTPRTEELTTRLEDLGFDVVKTYRPNSTHLRLSEEDVAKNEMTIRELIRRAADLPPTAEAP
jgi:hypothetical protein